MSSKFPVCLLTKGSRSTPDFLVSEVNLRPGRKVSPDNRDTILLASGFSSLSPNTGFPLSPTLQVNHDLCIFSFEQLKRIAVAENEKVRSTTYRSYTIEPDPRLCVIGSEIQKLQSFIDSYGGILDLRPILVSGYHPDVPTASDLNIHRESDGYRLEFSVRVPVNTESCTYCGACGPACPEACLNEHLFLDYSACTFCKECEKSCAHGAIDVHGVERRVMRIPAILVMDGVEVELPEEKCTTFGERDLPAFFATQFPSQVDEVVTCDASICQFSSRLGYGCRICVDTCRQGAITQDANGICINSLNCAECGGCVAACPTGAMQYERMNDSTFIAYFRSLQLNPGVTVVMGSEAALHALWWKRPEQAFENVLFIEYNQIKALSLFHLLFLYVSGAGRIVLLGLERELQDLDGIKRQVALAGSLLSTYCQSTNPVMIAPLPLFISQQIPPAEYLLSETLPDRLNGNRRENLAVILQFLTRQSGRKARIKANDRLPFATIFCNEERCTQCFACLNNCRIQALNTNADTLALLSCTALCVGCGICVQICPEKALHMVSGATLDERFFTRETLAEAEPMACRKCGKVFGTRKSFDRVMEILTRRESVDTRHFEYCETCRVVNLFENA